MPNPESAAPLRARVSRRLAIRLLHAAQSAGDQPFTAQVVAARQGDEPDDMRPLGAAPAGGAVWAHFHYRPDGRGPDASEFAAATPPLRLSASLEIKGVLQLHAWRCVAGCVEEVPLQISD